ncbi:MAG TPA: ribosomal protein S18-alanine N-acetyltransferase [Steroidobacteraceae bacterium]
MGAASDAVGLPHMALRPMNEDDVAVVIEIEQQAYPFPWTEGILRDCLRVGYGCCVLELGAILVGYGIIASGAGEAHLLNVCVREEFRGRGFGRVLIEHLLSLAAAAAATMVYLEVRPANVGAIRLYETLGFRQVGVRRGYYQTPAGREDALLMRRALGAP